MGTRTVPAATASAGWSSPAESTRSPTASSTCELLGHSRQTLQVDVGGMPHATFLRRIQLLGAEVAPQVREELEQQ